MICHGDGISDNGRMTESLPFARTGWHAGSDSVLLAPDRQPDTASSGLTVTSGNDGRFSGHADIARLLPDIHLNHTGSLPLPGRHHAEYRIQPAFLHPPASCRRTRLQADGFASSFRACLQQEPGTFFNPTPHEQRRHRHKHGAPTSARHLRGLIAQPPALGGPCTAHPTRLLLPHAHFRSPHETYRLRLHRC